MLPWPKRRISLRTAPSSVLVLTAINTFCHFARVVMFAQWSSYWSSPQWHGKQCQAFICFLWGKKKKKRKNICCSLSLWLNSKLLKKRRRKNQIHLSCQYIQEVNYWQGRGNIIHKQIYKPIAPESPQVLICFKRHLLCPPQTEFCWHCWKSFKTQGNMAQRDFEITPKPPRSSLPWMFIWRFSKDLQRWRVHT